MKKIYKAFLVVLLVDTITNILFAWLLGLPVTSKLFVTSLIFSAIVILVLNQLNIIGDS